MAGRKATAGKTTGAKPKHIPQRTCIACRQSAGKRSLIRIVRTEQGIAVDPSGKQAGRGAYLHPYQDCWQAALQGGRLGQALRTRLRPEDRQVLEAYMQTLPPTEADADAGDDARELQSPDAQATESGTRRVLDVYR